MTWTTTITRRSAATCLPPTRSPAKEQIYDHPQGKATDREPAQRDFHRPGLLAGPGIAGRGDGTTGARDDAELLALLADIALTPPPQTEEEIQEEAALLRPSLADADRDAAE